MSTAGIRSSFGAMRIALDLADRSAMRYDVYVRARYDMYRLREGTNVPARVSGCCFAHLDPDCLYWFDSTPTGVVSGQRTRGGGDNFLWARPRAWRAVLAQINDRFDETTARVFRGWGDVHPENLIQGAASILGLNVSGCGGPGPVLDAVPACAASKTSVTARVPRASERLPQRRWESRTRCAFCSSTRRTTSQSGPRTQSDYWIFSTYPLACTT